MANILRDELIENNYVSTNNIDDELPPTHVVLYLKNISGIDKKTVIEPIPLQQVLLNNQNPSLKLIDNKAIFCLTVDTTDECFGATNHVILKNFQSFYKENDISYYINLSINGIHSEIDPCSNIIDQINLNYIDMVEAKYQLDESNQPNNISLRNLTDEVLKIIVERGEEVDCNCPGATNVAILEGDSDYVVYSAITSVEINGVVYERDSSSLQGFVSLPPGIEIFQRRTPNYNYNIEFINNTPEILKFKVNNYTLGYYEIAQDNQTLNYVRQGVNEAENEYGYVTFCLVPLEACNCESSLAEFTVSNDLPLDFFSNNPYVKGYTLGGQEFVINIVQQNPPLNTVAGLLNWIFNNQVGIYAYSLTFSHLLTGNGMVIVNIRNSTSRCNKFKLELGNDDGSVFNFQSTLCEYQPA